MRALQGAFPLRYVLCEGAGAGEDRGEVVGGEGGGGGVLGAGFEVCGFADEMEMEEGLRIWTWILPFNVMPCAAKLDAIECKLIFDTLISSRCFLHTRCAGWPRANQFELRQIDILYLLPHHDRISGSGSSFTSPIF